MSVAIESNTVAQGSKDAFDAEFDVEPTVEQDDEPSPARMCLVTCGVFTCGITG